MISKSKYGKLKYNLLEIAFESNIHTYILTGTLKEQEKSRRKLDFQEKFRERSTDKVFKSKSFYLDSVLKSKATLIKKRIENLGGVRFFFLYGCPLKIICKIC